MHHFFSAGAQVPLGESRRSLRFT